MMTLSGKNIYSFLKVKTMKAFKKYDNDMTYNVRFIGGKRPVSMNNVKTLGDYTKQNESADIYFRPDNKSGHKYVLLDVDNNPTKQTLKSIQTFGAFYVIQTSKGHYQAWFYCPQITKLSEYQKFAKYIAVKFKGDIGAAHTKQIGRLPGYINHKKGRHNYKANVIYESKQNIETRFTPYALDQMVQIDNVIKTNDDIARFYHKLKSKHESRTRTQTAAPPPPPPPGGSHTSNPFPRDKAHDYAFISEVYEKDNSKTRLDLIRILNSMSRYRGNMTYIGQTVDHMLLRHS